MKISIIGCGKVGASVAYTTLLKGLAHELVLVDASQDKSRGEMLDILHCLAFSAQAKVMSGDMEATSHSDIVVLTAGIPRKADEPRPLLLSRNAGLVANLVRDAVKYSPQCILVMVTNPLDVMTELAYEVSGLPAAKVFGLGTVLDTARYRSYIADKFQLDARDIDAYVVGEHGETMVPLKSNISVRGIALASLPNYSEQLLDQIVTDVVLASGQVIALKGGTVFAPGSATAAVLEAIVRNDRAILPVSTHHSKDGVCYGFPAIIGREGVITTVTPSLTTLEQSLLEQSIESIRKYLCDLQNISY